MAAPPGVDAPESHVHLPQLDRAGPLPALVVRAAARAALGVDQAVADEGAIDRRAPGNGSRPSRPRACDIWCGQEAGLELRSARPPCLGWHRSATSRGRSGGPRRYASPRRPPSPRRAPGTPLDSAAPRVPTPRAPPTSFAPADANDHSEKEVATGGWWTPQETECRAGTGARSPRYRSRVREVSGRNRSHGVQYEPEPHRLPQRMGNSPLVWMANFSVCAPGRTPSDQDAVCAPGRIRTSDARFRNSINRVATPCC